MSIKTKNLFIVLVAAVSLLSACEVFDTTEDPKIYEGPNQVKFTQESVILFAEQDTEVGIVEVSSLKPQSSNKTYTFQIDTDKSTAVRDTDFTLASETVTIAKDSVIGKIELTLNKASLATPKTLYLKITDADSAVFNNEIEITLRQFTPYNQADFVGNFDLVYPWFYADSNPRTVELVAGGTENEVIIKEIFPVEGNGVDVVVTLDDSDRTNFTASFEETPGAWTHSAGAVSITADEGSFSAADLTITLQVFHSIPGVGNFGAATTMTLTKQ